MAILISIFILADSFPLEVKVRNTIESWHRYKPWVEDTSGITEDELSFRLSGLNLRGGLDILYHTYWDRKFKLKDTTATYISWKELVFEWSKGSLVLGNFYSTLGQGLLLGLEPEPQLGRDRRIDGIKAKLQLPWFAVDQMLGVPVEIDRLEKSYKIVNDTSDALFGVNTSFLPVGLPLVNSSLSVSGRVLRVKTSDTLYTNLMGADFEFSRGPILWYLELAKKDGWDAFGFEKNTGSGVYSSLDLLPFNIQFMKYDKLGVGGSFYRYNLFPILNRSGYSLTNGEDEIGVQLTAGKSVGDIIFDFSHSEIYSQSYKSKKILEYYLSADYLGFYSSLKYLLLAGQGVDPNFLERRELDYALHGSLKNVDFTLSMAQVAGLKYQDWIRWFDVGAEIEFPLREVMTLYSNYIRRSKEVIEECPGTEWYGIGLKVEPSSTLFFDFWWGKEKGGFICSGGICRELAPFDGLKLKLNISL